MKYLQYYPVGEIHEAFLYTSISWFTSIIKYVYIKSIHDFIGYLCIVHNVQYTYMHIPALMLPLSGLCTEPLPQWSLNNSNRIILYFTQTQFINGMEPIECGWNLVGVSKQYQSVVAFLYKVANEYHQVLYRDHSDSQYYYSSASEVEGM